MKRFPSYKGIKLKEKFYNMELSMNTDQKLILNVDGDCEGGLLVTRKMLAMSSNVVTPFLKVCLEGWINCWVSSQETI